MNLPYQLFIALRYLRSKKKHKGISVNTLISTGGVAVGVMALLVVLSVMSGFHEDLQRKILGVNAHIVILSYKGTMPGYHEVSEKIKEDKDIVSATPFVMGQVMVSNGNQAHGVFLRGIDPEKEIKTTDIARFMKEGRFEDLNQKTKPPALSSEKSWRQASAPSRVISSPSCLLSER